VIITHRVGYDPSDCFHVGFLAPSSDESIKISTSDALTPAAAAAAASCTNARHHSVVMATPDRVTNGPRRGHDDGGDSIAETTGGLQRQHQQQSWAK